MSRDASKLATVAALFEHAAGNQESAGCRLFHSRTLQEPPTEFTSMTMLLRLANEFAWHRVGRVKEHQDNGHHT